MNKTLMRCFKNLDVYTENDKKKLLGFFKLRVQNKRYLLGDNFIKNINYQKKINVIDKSEVYDEVKKIEIGAEKWFDNLSKKSKTKIKEFAWRDSFKSDEIKLSDEFYNNILDVCYSKVIESFREDFLDDDGDVDFEVIQYFYDNNKLPQKESDKLYKIYDYIFEEDMIDWLDENGILKKEIFDRYKNGGLPTTTKEKMRITLSRTKDKFDNLAKTNCDKFKYFITLTFADSKNMIKHLENNSNRLKDDVDFKFIYIDKIKEFESCNLILTKFLNNMKQRFKKNNKDLYYLGVPEFQKNGNIHYHLLINDVLDSDVCDVPSWLDFDYFNGGRNWGTMFYHWKYGKSDIQEINDSNRVTSYIAKYLVKNLHTMDEQGYYDNLNKRRYYYSRNLDKPVVEYNVEKTYLNEDNYSDIFTKVNKNGFNGSYIETNIYTINKGSD